MSKHTPSPIQPQLPFGDTGPNPSGLCMCGCGQPAPLATMNSKQKGWIKGQPIRFINKHQGVKRRASLNGLNLPADARAIPLTHNKFAIVDAADYEWLSHFFWSAKKSGNTWYAERTERLENGKRHTLKMHRVILDAPAGIEVDHKNLNGLDNRRDNLRPATPRQNKLNKSTTSSNTSGFKGVSWNKIQRKWMAYITIDGKRKYLGMFTNAEEGARAYDDAAHKYFGEFARLNFEHHAS